MRPDTRPARPPTRRRDGSTRCRCLRRARSPLRPSTARGRQFVQPSIAGGRSRVPEFDGSSPATTQGDVDVTSIEPGPTLVRAAEPAQLDPGVEAGRRRPGARRCSRSRSACCASPTTRPRPRELGRSSRLLEVQDQVAGAADALRQERDEATLFVAGNRDRRPRRAGDRRSARPTARSTRCRSRAPRHRRARPGHRCRALRAGPSRPARPAADAARRRHDRPRRRPTRSSPATPTSSARSTSSTARCCASCARPGTAGPRRRA